MAILSSIRAAALKDAMGASALKCSRTILSGGTLQITIVYGEITDTVYPWLTLTDSNVAGTGNWYPDFSPPEWGYTYESTDFVINGHDFRSWVWGGAGLHTPTVGDAHQVRIVGPLSGTLVRYPLDAVFAQPVSGQLIVGEHTDPTSETPVNDYLASITLPTPTSAEYYNLAFGEELIMRVLTQPTLTSPFSQIAFCFAFNKGLSDFPWYPL